LAGGPALLFFSAKICVPFRNVGSTPANGNGRATMRMDHAGPLRQPLVITDGAGACPKSPIGKRLGVCFDENPTQFIGEVRQPIKLKPGQLERYMSALAPLSCSSSSTCIVTDRRTATAACMQKPVDVHSQKRSASASCWF
jgi:hypothetical protein